MWVDWFISSVYLYLSLSLSVCQFIRGQRRRSILFAWTLSTVNREYPRNDKDILSLSLSWLAACCWQDASVKLTLSENSGWLAAAAAAASRCVYGLHNNLIVELLIVL